MSGEDSAAVTAAGNPLWIIIVFCDIPYSGIILTSDSNWLITIENMTTANKVKAMVSGDMFLHIFMYI